MEIDLEALSKWYGKYVEFIPLPKYADEKRDFAFVMDKDITCAQVEDVIKESCEYVTEIKLFDVYEGTQLPKDKKSMAFSVTFTPKDEELKSKKVDSFVENILSNLNGKYGISLRA